MSKLAKDMMKAGLDPLKSKKNKRRGEMTNKPAQYRVEAGSVFEFYPEDNGPGAYWFIGKLNGKTLKQFIAAIARRACYGEAEDQQMYLR